MPRFDRKQLAIPYAIFLLLFVVLPLLVVVYYGFTDANGNLSFNNFVMFFSSSKTIGTLLYSLVIGVLVTFICLLFAYPIAFILAKGAYSRKHSFLMVFVLPMWINFNKMVNDFFDDITIADLISGDKF